MQQLGVLEDAVQPSYDGGPNMNLNPQGAGGGAISYGSDVLGPALFGGGGSVTSQHRGESRSRGGAVGRPPTANDPLHTRVGFFANHDFVSDPMALYDGVSNLFGSWKPGRRTSG